MHRRTKTAEKLMQVAPKNTSKMPVHNEGAAARDPRDAVSAAGVDLSKSLIFISFSLLDCRLAF